MPPPAVKTIRDLIYYQYSKMIAKEAGEEDNFRFIMAKFQELRSGKISWSNLTREYRIETMRGKVCIFCGSAQGTTLDHIIPFSRGGPDTADNLVMICRSCNSSKGDKDPYYWWVKVKGNDKDDLPRVVVGKYLKLIYDMHNDKGTLDAGDLDGDGKLTVFDLGFMSGKTQEPKQSVQKPSHEKIRESQGKKQIVSARVSKHTQPTGRKAHQKPLVDAMLDLVKERAEEKLDETKKDILKGLKKAFRL